MNGVSVSRLRLRASAGLVAEARQRSEDALRLAAGGDDRLLVLRSLDLGIMPPRVDPRRWEERAAALIRTHWLRAIHGGQAGAESADVVWFHSVEEARRLLLLALLSGRGASAWFWRLAVPDWQGLPFRQMWRRLVADESAHPRTLATLARTTIALIEAGYLREVLQGLNDRAADALDEPLRPDTGRSDAASADSTAIAGSRANATRLIARLAAVTRGRVAAALSDTHVAPAARRRLAMLALIAAAPDLSDVPAERARLAEPLLTQSAARIPPVNSLPALHAADRALGPHRRANRPRPAPAPPAPGSSGLSGPGTGRRREIRSPLDSTAAPRAAQSAIEPMTAAGLAASPELASAAAGLFLLVRPLWRMGVEERTPPRFGRLLLRHIARRMRVPADDAVFALLDVEDDGDADLLNAWRVGADRWLRRTARRKLADVVNRRGWLMAREDGVTVRFRVDAADIRLRRRAFDLDPGWVGWLGMVIRYHFRDEPLP